MRPWQAGQCNTSKRKVRFNSSAHGRYGPRFGRASARVSVGAICTHAGATEVATGFGAVGAEGGGAIFGRNLPPPPAPRHNAPCESADTVPPLQAATTAITGRSVILRRYFDSALLTLASAARADIGYRRFVFSARAKAVEHANPVITGRAATDNSVR
jgi:hypothetical protein